MKISANFTSRKISIFYLKIIIKKFRIFDLINKVESLIFENFQILHHAKNRNSDMQQSYKRNLLHLTSCTKYIESLIIEKIPDYNYIKNIDIPICNNHNKEILI